MLLKTKIVFSLTLLFLITKQADFNKHFSPKKTLISEPITYTQNAEDFLSIYPIPIKEGLYINVVYENSTNDRNTEIQILSMEKVVVKTIDSGPLEKGTNNIPIDLSDLSLGDYHLQLKREDGTFSRVRIAVAKL